MDREITVEMTPKLVGLTIFYQLRRNFLSFIILAAILAFFTAGSLLREVQIWLFLSPLIFIPVVFGFAYYSAYTKSMAMIRKMKTPVIKFRITDECLYIDCDITSGKNSWSIYKGLMKNARLWQIVTQSGASHVIPAERLDGELKEFLSAKLPKPPSALSRQIKILVVLTIVFLVLMYFFTIVRH